MEKRSGSNNQAVKKNNTNLILKLVITGEGISRIDIAKKTGLSKMTVTNLISELIENGILCEREAAVGNSVGRRPITLDIADSSPLLCGLYINRDRLVMVVSTLKLELLEKSILNLDEKENNDSLTIKIFSLFNGFHKKYKKRILAIGISCIGPVDVAAGSILAPPNFHQIKDLNIADLLTKKFHLPVFLDNDMNTSALCERLFGFGKELDNFIYLGITNGIGAGIISGGTLLTGSGGFAGELGHITTCPDGLPCYCGNTGCLEQYASIPEIMKKLNVNPDKESFEEAVSNYQNTELFQQVMSEVMRQLVLALTGICNILDPQAIVIGHEGYFLPDSFLMQMENEINAKILTKGYKTVKILKTEFKSEIPIKGSLALVLSRLFEGKID